MTLGEAFQQRRNTQSAGVLEQLVEAVKADVRADLTTPPVVHVAAPNVQVAGPTIRVPDHPAPDVHIDLAPLTAKMDVIHSDLQTLIALLRQPVTRTVERSGGMIQSIKESRGN